MNYITNRTLLKNVDLLKELQEYIEQDLDKISMFDYTAFSHVDSDQFTIDGINVTIAQNKIELCNFYSIDFYDAYDPYYHGGGGYKISKGEFRLSINICNSNVTSIKCTCRYNNDQSSDFLKLYVGEKKYLISNTWVDRIGFEEMVFQESTVTAPEPFDINFISNMLTKLQVTN